MFIGLFFEGVKDGLGRDSEDIYDDKIKPLSSRIYPKECQVTGIEMPMFDGTLTEDQHEMFDIISEGVKSIDEIPKIIFVSDMGFGVIGLVIEHRGLWDMPDVSLMSDVRVVDAMGQTRSLYSEEVKSLIPSRYPESLKKSFIKHVGKSAFFYSCPVLNILIHGFEEKAVEAFTRHSITKHFEAIESGVNCTAEQKEFYDRFLTDYLDKGPNFPVFENIF